MKIAKGLIIADPWIGYILDGTKDWEMRSSVTSHRGWFGLIRKGTGAVYGVARLTDVGRPLSPVEMMAAYEHHRIPDHMVRSGEVAKWNTPWVLADVRGLSRPVSYKHKSGAVTWVELDEAATEGLASALRGIKSFDSRATDQLSEAFVEKSQSEALSQPSAEPRRPISPAVMIFESRWIGEIEINEANLRNNHFYLRPLIDRFPADVIGGSNKASAARREVTIDWGGPKPVQTDIDGKDKKFFRARGWIGAFYRLNGAQAGDVVVIEETAPYRYRVRVQKVGVVGGGS
ncbi:hypothetical protein [Chelatococcus reniformis]|uniref:ASCH domain-containing protein n=1 Tax=Chelatococcus reniformis TaxID=1494448 RepID=A0A916US45_9HYPH|nr:hypothetical protein [Chelatococcus reniformis]GGC85678.1 hypothetical protein GCM10010994_49450 [Chelatococcus reniformis]